MRQLSTVIAVSLLVALASGCDRKEAHRVDNPDELVRIENRTGEIELVLTTAALAMQLSKDTLAEIDTELKDTRESLDDHGGLVRRFANFVIDGVGNYIGEAIVYPIDEIERIDWDGEELIIEVTDPKFVSFDKISVDGERSLKTFDEDSARRLIAAFNQLRTASDAEVSPP